MAKRKAISQESSSRDGSPESVNSLSSITHKKHKKHKKKHKKRQSEEPEAYRVLTEADEGGGTSKGSIKLKLKIGAETFGMKNIVTVKSESSESMVTVKPGPMASMVNIQPGPSDAFITVSSEPTDVMVNVTDDIWDDDDVDPTIKTKKPGDDTSDEEKEWLSALEKGELDDYGEVNKKREKDPALMTARQRAMKHGNKDTELLQLPTGYRQVELTEEQLKRREQRAHKRKQMAQEKREKDKKQTIDRLLKKQESKLKGSKMRGTRKADVPKVTYVNDASGITISVPSGVAFPFQAQTVQTVKPAAKCAVAGCANNKKYSCSKTGVPLCSLECYKKNLSVHKLTIPGVVTT